MNRLPVITFAAFLSSFAWPAMAGDGVIEQLAQRTELRPFATMTLTDHQFLVGDKAGKPVTIAGELRIPQGVSGKLPAVIIVHGSGGVNAGNELWAHVYNQMGVATFLIDSFSGRGLVATSTDQSQLGRFNMILDIYRARDVLAAHPRIDPARIAVQGHSRGAQSVLYSSLKRFQQMWAGPGADFAAYIPLYTPCDAPAVIGETDISDRPIRMFHGSSDDFVVVAPCRDLVQRLRAAGKDVVLTEFPDTWHTFDNPLGNRTPTVSADAQTMRHCTIKEEPMGLIINAVTQQPFTYDDPCIERNPHAAYNEAALHATQQAVTDLLRTVFKLN